MASRNWMSLSGTASREYPTNGIGGVSTTRASGLYIPPRFTFAGQPADTNTCRVVGYYSSEAAANFTTTIFEFDDNAATTLGRTGVTIGASTALSITALVTAINATPACGFTAVGDATNAFLVPRTGGPDSIVTHVKSGGNITVNNVATMFHKTLVQLIGFQPEATGAIAGGTFAIADEAAGTTIITLPIDAAAAAILPYIDLSGLKCSTPGLSVISSSANLKGTLYWREI